MLIVDMILNTSHHLNDHEIEFGFVVNWIQKRYKHIHHMGSNAWLIHIFKGIIKIANIFQHLCSSQLRVQLEICTEIILD